MIDKLTEQRIKEAAGIVDVVSDFVQLRRAGVNFQCLCPFHEDRHIGSFVVSPSKNVYKCFSCDAKGGPIDWLLNYAHMTYPDALRYLADKYGIVIDEPARPRQWQNIRPATPRQLQPSSLNLPPKTWPVEWAGYYAPTGDNLVSWLRSHKWDGAQRAALERAILEYHVGHASILHKGEAHEFTLFWQIDENNVLHNCHMMKYLPDGHRDKESDYTQTWLHARMRYNDRFCFDDRMNSASYCLFGQHLLNAYPRAAVNIVESEKTALVMAAAYGNNDAEVWMACAGLQNLNRDRLAPLIKAGRKIVVFPDRDGIRRWTVKATDLNYSNCFINIKAVDEWWQPEDGDKADIADVVLRMIDHAQPRLSTYGMMMRDYPQFAHLTDKFHLIPTEHDTTEGHHESL